MKIRETLIRKDGQYYVRNESTHWSEPVVLVRHWRVSVDRARRLDALLGRRVVDYGYHGIYSCDPNDQDYFAYSLRDAVAPLVNGSRTEAELCNEYPVPRPKVRKGIEVRWHDGQWQKLLKRGWVDLGADFPSIPKELVT